MDYSPKSLLAPDAADVIDIGNARILRLETGHG